MVVFRYPPGRLLSIQDWCTYGKSEVNALDVDMGRELVRGGQERPKFFPIFTENRLNVIWPLHLNG